MEEAEQELKELEAELRSFAAHELRPREADAALLARLMQRADAACRPRAVKPWYSRYSTWGASAAVACLAVMFVFVQVWYSAEPFVEVSRTSEAPPQQQSSAPHAFTAVDSIPAQIQELPQMPMVAEIAAEPVPIAVNNRVRGCAMPCATVAPESGAEWTNETALAQTTPCESSVAGGGKSVLPDAVQPDTAATTSYSSDLAIYSAGSDVVAAMSVDEESCEECEMRNSLNTALAVHDERAMPRSKSMRAGRAKRKAAAPTPQMMPPSVGAILKQYAERCMLSITSGKK